MAHCRDQLSFSPAVNCHTTDPSEIIQSYPKITWTHISERKATSPAFTFIIFSKKPYHTLAAQFIASFSLRSTSQLSFFAPKTIIIQLFMTFFHFISGCSANVVAQPLNDLCCDWLDSLPVKISIYRPTADSKAKLLHIVTHS